MRSVLETMVMKVQRLPSLKSCFQLLRASGNSKNSQTSSGTSVSGTRKDLLHKTPRRVKSRGFLDHLAALAGQDPDLESLEAVAPPQSFKFHKKKTPKAQKSQIKSKSSKNQTQVKSTLRNREVLG